MRKSRTVRVRDLMIGGGNPIVVQSMTNTPTQDIKATTAQIKQLERAGCELVRVAVVNMEAAFCLSEIKSKINIPLVADIHYDHRLALRAIEEGVDMLRLNPGNITKRSKIEEIVKSAKDKAIPIRVGVNSGSLPNFKGPKDMVEAALREVEILEGMNFYDIIISLKSPDVPLMLAANRMIADQVDYPLHLGVTEAGFGESGVVKSAVGIGILLEEGIGDTIRVSLTGDPVREVKVAYEILSCLGYRRRGIQITSCPTCGRCEIDLEGIISRLKEKLKDKMDTLNLKVSLMGCAVNGIGEAAHSDIGLVGAKNSGNLYKEGKLVGRVPEERIVDELVRMIKERERERKRERERGGGEAF